MCKFHEIHGKFANSNEICRFTSPNPQIFIESRDFNQNLPGWKGVLYAFTVNVHIYTVNVCSYTVNACIIYVNAQKY